MSDKETRVIPKLRTDLDYIPYENDGDQFLLLRDPLGYGEDIVMVRPEAWLIFSHFDGRRTVSEISDELKQKGDISVLSEQISELADHLEKHLFLESDRYATVRKEKDAEFLSSPVRPATHAGQSYPEDIGDLRKFFDDLFEADTTEVTPGTLSGIIVPHIDLQIGPATYLPGFKYLAAAEFDTVVFLGTSHYSYEDLFLLTTKDYQTPFGLAETDQDLVNMLHEKSGNIFTRNDLAHRQEHSIEFPLLFLQHMLGEKNVNIVPVLISSFEEFLVEKSRPLSSDRYNAFVQAFGETVELLGRKVVYVLGIDWSHIGRKFGDQAAAEDILDVVRKSDQQHFDALERIDYDRFYNLVQSSGNSSRIDGFACISTYFDLAKPRHGKLLSYEQWHEKERESAVTFASMAFFDE